MDAVEEEYCGAPAQQALLLRGRAMFELVRDDLRDGYCGRTVGISGPDAASLETLAALATLQENSNVADLPDAEPPRWRAATRARGLAPVVYARRSAGADAMRAAQASLADHAPPGDLTILPIDRVAPRDRLARLSEVALACGVLPPAAATGPASRRWRWTARAAPSPGPRRRRICTPITRAATNAGGACRRRCPSAADAVSR